MVRVWSIFGEQLHGYLGAWAADGPLKAVIHWLMWRGAGSGTVCLGAAARGHLGSPSPLVPGEHGAEPGRLEQFSDVAGRVRTEIPTHA